MPSRKWKGWIIKSIFWNPERDHILANRSQNHHRWGFCGNSISWSPWGSSRAFDRKWDHILYHDTWKGHELVTVSALINGGGAIACLRMTGYLTKDGRGRPPPNNGPHRSQYFGGLLPEHGQQIPDHNYSVPLTSDIGNGTETTNANQTVLGTKSIDTFDVMIYRIHHGWIPIHKVSKCQGIGSWNLCCLRKNYLEYAQLFCQHCFSM